ncbi:MAG TPA: hypothetical protein VFT74_02990, partial [Isosphaeraceae bacterium]|nr:hypothetical protein [Isosphaeraceae bacterium]
MAKKHGAKQQKKEAKKKAKRAEKRSQLAQRTSNDPTVRLKGVGDWSVHEAWVATSLWEQGIGYTLISRHEPKGGLIYASYLVDVYCLGVKNAFWDAGTNGDFKEMLQNLEGSQPMERVSPACLAKMVKGAVEFAASFGFRPHPDFRHAGLLLAGIDVGECAEEFTFGKDGKPFYIRGPYETPAQANAILERIKAAGGDG